ncbi:MAG TPA: type VI secretion system contractile sheath large subunit [Burkholderiales bacterium]|nr:type VI secretion system contractile sheath large subunit [Burkholderiales bacterium]
MAGRTSFEFELGSARARRRPDDESPMRILVLGDFGGRMAEPARVDVDDFDRVMAQVGPRLRLPVEGGDDITLQFATLEDFHPDTLYRRLPLFQELRSTRLEPDTQTFARLLGGTPPAAPRAQGGPAAHPYVQALLREAVQAHIVPDAPAHQAVYTAAIDAATADAMRVILRHPQFKALEALWRGVHWLVSNLETDGELELHILDASRAELASNFEAFRENITSSGPWSLVIGDYSFGLADEDLELLARLGAAASHAGGPFLAAAAPELAAGTSERWDALRKSAVAPWIGLALPRMLLRLPYGKSVDPIESFPFEELAPRRHESYLWGNGALACALLIGRAFAARGWDMEPGDELEVEDLPAHTYDEGGEKRMQPCAEAALVDRAAEAILDAGLMPLLSYKNRNAVRVARFQSIARPAQALNGPWS